jgi:DNA-binding LytR/AlgR family response regulator
MYILVTLTKKLKKNLEEVIMLKGDGNYTYVYFTDGSKSLISYTLKRMEIRLSELEYFVRPNKSVILNIKYTSRYNGMVLDISLPSGELLYSAVISRRKKIIIKHKMNKLKVK